MEAADGDGGSVTVVYAPEEEVNEEGNDEPEEGEELKEKDFDRFEYTLNTFSSCPIARFKSYRNHYLETSLQIFYSTLQSYLRFFLQFWMSLYWVNCYILSWFCELVYNFFPVPYKAVIATSDFAYPTFAVPNADE